MSDNRVFIAECRDYGHAETAVNRVLDAFGGAAGILNGRKTVLVKPNLVMPKKPDAACTTHPAVVTAVCRAFVKAGASVSLIDSTAAPHTAATLSLLYKTCGMDKAAADSGASLCFDTGTRRVTRPENHTLKELTVLSPLLDAELVVTVGKVKTHGFGYYSGAVKNLFGALPGMDKPMTHRRFPDPGDFFSAITDICETINPGFALLDGVTGMEGNGPCGGTPKALGAVLGGINPFAADMAAARLAGLRAESIHIQNEAVRRGLVCAEFEQLSLLGDDWKPLLTQFRPPDTGERLNWFWRNILPKKLLAKIRFNRAKYPEITERCVGCGDCARVCPQKVITVENKRAVIDRRSCIKCYCCHEFCPFKAIEFENGKGVPPC